MSVCRINKLFLSKDWCAFYKGEHCENLNATSPFLMCLFFLYKSVMRVLLIATSPLPFGLSPIAQTCAISLQNLASFARGEVGTRIDRYRSLIIPLRFVRQAWPTTRRSRLYFPSSSALQCSPPLRLGICLRIGTYRV